MSTRDGPVMELTLLAVPDCPGAAALEELLTVVLADHPGVTVHRREIGDERAAAETGMCGSPTLLINGKDSFVVPGQAPGLSTWPDQRSAHVCSDP